MLSDNIFSEQETKRAKKIFMSRLSDYLDAQQSNKTGFDISTLGMEKLPKKLVQMDSPFFLLKRKKSVPPQETEYEPNYRVTSFKNLQ